MILEFVAPKRSMDMTRVSSWYHGDETNSKTRVNFGLTGLQPRRQVFNLTSLR